MKDHVKTGGIFRLKNTAALKHTRPPTSRPSTFSRQGKGVSRPIALGNAPRRRVAGLPRPPQGSTFARALRTPLSKSANLLLQRRRSSVLEEEAEEGPEDAGDDSSSDSDTSPSPSPQRVVQKVKRVTQPVVELSSEDEDSSSEEENSSEGEGEGEGEEEKEEEEEEEEEEKEEVGHVPKRRTPVRHTAGAKKTVEKKRRTSARVQSPSVTLSPALRKRRATAAQKERSEEKESDVSHPKVAKKATGTRKPRRRATPAPSSTKEKESTPVRKRKQQAKKTPSPRLSPVGVRSSGRRARKPVTQWWAANPETSIDLGCHPESKPRRRLSEPQAEAREARRSPPAKEKRRAPRSKPQSEPRKRRKKATEDEGEEPAVEELPKPVLINSSDEEEAITPQQSVFAKASPAKKIASARRRSLRATPLNKKNLDSPHLTPITPMRASRLVQALFTFDGQEEAQEAPSFMEEFPPGASAVPMQPLRSSHDEFGMPNLPYPENAALADANWYTLDQ